MLVVNTITVIKEDNQNKCKRGWGWHSVKIAQNIETQLDLIKCQGLDDEPNVSDGRTTSGRL